MYVDICMYEMKLMKLMYAPQVRNSVEEKHIFKELDAVLGTASIVMGDCYAQVGSEKQVYEDVSEILRIWKLEQRGDASGLVSKNGLKVGNSWFQKRETSYCYKL